MYHINVCVRCFSTYLQCTGAILRLGSFKICPFDDAILPFYKKIYKIYASPMFWKNMERTFDSSNYI